MSTHEDYERHVGKSFSKAGWKVASNIRLAGRQVDHVIERRRLFRKERRIVEAKDLAGGVGVRDLGTEFSKYQDLKRRLNVGGLIVTSPVGFTRCALDFARRHPDIELMTVAKPVDRSWVWIVLGIVSMLISMCVLWLIF